MPPLVEQPRNSLRWLPRGPAPRRR